MESATNNDNTEVEAEDTLANDAEQPETGAQAEDNAAGVKKDALKENDPEVNPANQPN